MNKTWMCSSFQLRHYLYLYILVIYRGFQWHHWRMCYLDMLHEKVTTEGLKVFSVEDLKLMSILNMYKMLGCGIIWVCAVPLPYAWNNCHMYRFVLTNAEFDYQQFAYDLNQVDIVTMLDEAHDWIKFLEHQVEVRLFFPSLTYIQIIELRSIYSAISSLKTVREFIIY